MPTNQGACATALGLPHHQLQEPAAEQRDRFDRLVGVRAGGLQPAQVRLADEVQDSEEQLVLALEAGVQRPLGTLSPDRTLPAVATRDIAAVAARLLLDTSSSSVALITYGGPMHCPGTGRRRTNSVCADVDRS